MGVLQQITGVAAVEGLPALVEVMGLRNHPPAAMLLAYQGAEVEHRRVPTGKVVEEVGTKLAAY